MELANGVITETARTNELACDVEFEVLAVAPVEDAPLKQQHVGLRVRSKTSGPNGLVERQRALNQLRHGELAWGEALLLQELLKRGERSGWLHLFGIKRGTAVGKCNYRSGQRRLKEGAAREAHVMANVEVTGLARLYAQGPC